VHHAYLKQTLPSLESTLASFVKKHHNKYPYLPHLQEVFHELSVLLLGHTAEEEEKIFPYIKQISHTHKHKEIYGHLFVKTLSRPLAQVVRSEHTYISAQLAELRKAANQYSFPDDVCTSHRVVFQQLKELDADIVQHKHLENNVLFPKAINLERELLQVQ
jgi:regulator of cell morphogenesis and NO signaling